MKGLLFLLILSIDLTLSKKHNSNEISANKKRIVGGDDVNITIYPFLVSIQIRRNYDYVHHCGGTIITLSQILTAAHCAYYSKDWIFTPFDLYGVFIGLQRADHQNPEQNQMTGVSAVRVHPEFDKTFLFNDIAILGLKIKIRVDGSFKPEVVQLPDFGMFDSKAPDDYYGENELCFAVGWGRTNETDSTSGLLLKHVGLPIIRHSHCDKLVEPFTETQFCTLRWEHDVCFGDSGGPLICHGIQVGIVSWGSGCAQNDSPNVWTRVDIYWTWINQTVVDLKEARSSSGKCVKYIVIDVNYDLLILVLINLRNMY